MNRLKKLLFFFVLLFSSSELYSQSTVTVSGRIIGEDYSALENATIYVAQSSTGVFSDSTGEFRLSLAAGLTEISFSYIGYRTLQFSFFLSKDTVIEIRMKRNLQLSEVTVVDKKKLKAAEHDVMGVITLRKENFNSLPTMLGENDPMRAVQMQPGIQSGNEGSRGIFVRGGSPDQNLMLLDGFPVYNPSHLYGFISVFNGEGIEKIDVYKDHYPARYGGRLGSVMDIEATAGNSNRLKGSVSVGFVTSRFHLEGPLSRNKKTTFSVSARVCYIGAYTSPISKKKYKDAGYDGDIGYYFGDANVKLAHRFSEKDKLEFSFFTNSDFYAFTKLGGSTDSLYSYSSKYVQKVNWSNYVSSAGWVHAFNTKWETKNAFGVSHYHITSLSTDHYYQPGNAFFGEYKGYYDSKSTSFIRELAFKSDWKYRPDSLHTLRMGAAFKHLTFETGKGSERIENTYLGNSDTTFDGDRIHAAETSVYIEDEFRPAKQWLVNAGFHVMNYSVEEKTYFTFLPRLNIVYSPVKNFSLRASGSGLSQNLHLLVTSSADVLNDYWVPATAKALPESGWNISGGMVHKLPLSFEWSIDGFYRTMNNLVEYKEGTEHTYTGETWIDQVVTGGTGRAYGAEFYFARSYGRITGSIAYTLAWSQRKFAELNGGKYFAYKYDRRHNVALQVNFLASRYIELGLSWVYGSGNMYTMPLQSYNTYSAVYYRDMNAQNGNTYPYAGEEISVYAGKNNFRLPAYHHLDLSFTYKKKTKKLEHLFNLSIYNVYNRFNIFSIYSDFRVAGDGTRSLVFKQLSLFPVLPSVAYTIKFGG